MAMKSETLPYLELLFFTLMICVFSVGAAQGDISFTQDERDFIKNHPEVIVGGEEDWPPFDFVRDGKYVGVANDYLGLLEKNTGITFQVETGHSWRELLQLMASKQIDLLPMLYWSEQRLTSMHFTKPYLTVRHYVFVAGKAKGIDSMRGLEAKTVAIPKGYAQIELLKLEYPKIHVLEVGSPLEAIDAVVTQRADALIENTALVSHLLKEHNIQGIKPAFATDLGVSQLYMAARKDWPLLRDIIQKGLDAITAEEKNRIAHTWITLDTPARAAGNESSEQLIMNEEERAYLQQKGVIKACVDPNWMPLEKLENGIYIGMGADYMDIFQAKLGIPIQAVLTDSWAQSVAYAKARQCDIFMLSMDTPERRVYMNVTKPYLKLPLVIATRLDIVFLSEFEEMENKTIGIVEGYALADVVKMEKPNIDFVFVPSSKVGMRLVAEGELFGFLDTVSTIGHAIQKDYFGELKIGGQFGINWELGVAARNDEPLLGEIFERAVTSISEQKKREITNRWLAIKYVQGLDYVLLSQIVTVFLVILLFVFYRHWQLVRHRHEQEKARVALAATQARYRELVENSSDWIWEVDEQARFTYVSPVVKKVLGYDSEEILGGSPFDLMPKDEAERVSLLFMDIMAQRRPFNNLENINHHCDGGRVVLEASGTPVFGADGAFLGYRVTDRNITERKRIEVKLQESEERYRGVVEDTPVLICRFLPNTEITYANKAYRRYFEKRPEELAGTSFLALIPEDYQAAVLSNLQSLTKSSSTQSLEYRVFAPDGTTRWQRWTNRALFDEEGNVVAYQSVGEDVNERKEAEKESERLQRELQQKHKMEALGQLTGGIAHDFNNILGIVMGFTSMALERYSHEAPEKMVDYLNTAMKASGRAKSLVAQMLAFSRVNIDDEEPTQLTPLVKENIEMMESILPSSIRIEFNCEDDLPNALMDPTKLQQILMNLCINAKDAMQDVGVLTFDLGWRQSVGAECSSCHKWIDGDWIDLSVTDTGCGMTAEVLKHLFEPFYTTKEVGKGTGMGMAVLHGVVRSYGGHTLVETDLGKGTTIHLLFPAVTTEEGGASALETPPQQLPQGQRHHVLVLDDEPELADYVGELLELHKYQATILTDSHDALDLFLQDPDKFSLLVTDQTMPGLTGMELVRKIHEVRPGFPVILCSGNSEAINKESVEGSDIQFLSKPVDADMLIQSAGDLLGLTVE